jgi:hypothetical protein
MLQPILERAYNAAKVNGFDFNPKATTRKASVVWMCQALEKSYEVLPYVVSTLRSCALISPLLFFHCFKMTS